MAVLHNILQAIYEGLSLSISSATLYAQSQILTVLVDARYCLIMVLIYISLMINDVVHFL